MEENKNLENFTEEEITEKLVDGKKMYTEEEFNSRLDEIIGKRLARERAKLQKEHDREMRKYREVEDVLNSGMGTSSIEEATQSLRNFYTKKGIKMPDSQPRGITEEEENILAEHQAKYIIEGGYDEVVEEVNRLADIGYENMSSRDKVLFTKLAEARKYEEEKRELNRLGISEKLIEDSEFKEFQGMFDSKIPMKKVYDMYQKMNPQKQFEQIGSLKNVPEEKVKDYYTPDEARRLTSKDLDNPKVMEAVERSMTLWYKNK